MLKFIVSSQYKLFVWKYVAVEVFVTKRYCKNNNLTNQHDYFFFFAVLLVHDILKLRVSKKQDFVYSTTVTHFRNHSLVDAF